MFQEKMNNVFGNLDGPNGIAEHDQHILNVLDTARENNIRFNPDTFQVKWTKHPFLGLRGPQMV